LCLKLFGCVFSQIAIDYIESDGGNYFKKYPNEIVWEAFSSFGPGNLDFDLSKGQSGLGYSPSTGSAQKIVWIDDSGSNKNQTTNGNEAMGVVQVTYYMANAVKEYSTLYL